jgi:hypothetical protein
VKTRLDIPAALDGQLWRYRLPGSRLARHHHTELEMDHVIRGHASLLVGNEKVQLEPHSMIWLFPGQEHLVVEHSDDFEMWIACWRRGIVRRYCVTPSTRPLRARREERVHCRHLDPGAARRLCTLLAEVSAYEDAATYNAGLGHVLLHAWLQFQQAED